MTNNFYQDVDNYFEKHNKAITQIKELFQKNTNGDVELKNPENGKVEILETAENMRSISTDFLNVQGPVGSRRSFSPERIYEATVELGDGENAVQIDIHELNELTANVLFIRNFWVQEPEKIIQDSITVLGQDLS